MATNVGSDFHSGGTVLVEGVPALVRKLRAAGNDLSEMRELMHKLGTIVIANAHPPRKSGAVAASLRAGRGATKAVVRAGYAKRAAYAGVLHYGDPHRDHRPHPFLTDSLKRSRGQVLDELTRGINQILKDNDLT